ncbi:MAG TPA: FAD-dependent oxidoreductase [Caldilineaceae bacterium]|nr:FAD-dependent oxidoreductase [Caldilineaceae bacterium]
MSTATALASYGLPYWLDLPRPTFPQLERDCTADAVVIGAGICGLKMARVLNQQGLRTVLLEGGRVGDGASSRNQGSINHGAGLSYATAIARYGRAAARQLWQLGLENHRLIREQIDEYQIDCDYEVAGYTYLARRDQPNWEATLASYRTETTLLQEDGFDVAFLDEQEAAQLAGGPHYGGGYSYRTDAQFHSGKYQLGLATAVAQLPHIALYEQSRVRTIARVGGSVTVKTDRATVTTPRVFLALNALAPQFVPDLAGGLRAERGQILVTEPLAERPCHGSFGTAMAWWRELPEADGRFRLLFGGGRAREEPDSLFPQFTTEQQPHPLLESEGFRPSVAHQQRLDSEFAKLFPHLVGARISHRWGGLQSFTADDLPQMGLFDEERQLYGVAGLCGRGNCYSDVGAQYVVGQALGVVTPVGLQYGALLAERMAVRRPAATWGGVGEFVPVDP